jgi:hypothetical protein
MGENKPDETTVTTLFQHMMKRPPNTNETAILTKKVSAGASFADVMTWLASTPEYAALNAVHTRWPNGHYHSPVVDPSVVGSYLTEQRASDLHGFGGIEIDVETMIKTFEESAPWLRGLDLPTEKSAGRYYETGGPFPLGDAYTLALIMQRYRPRRIIEIGSGFSTACMLDIAEREGLETKITCIEPFAARLKSLLRPADERRVNLIEDFVQTVPVGLFSELERGDILFIDSSHVLKTGSDVHYEIFNILPILKPGVIVHLHDCPYPFEYPEKWVFDWNHSWNEVYALRAFLMFNDRYSVLMWPSMLKHVCGPRVNAAFPEFPKFAASSIWLGLPAG